MANKLKSARLKLAAYLCCIQLGLTCDKPGLIFIAVESGWASGCAFSVLMPFTNIAFPTCALQQRVRC